MFELAISRRTVKNGKWNTCHLGYETESERNIAADFITRELKKDYEKKIINDFIVEYLK